MDRTNNRIEMRLICSPFDLWFGRSRRQLYLADVDCQRWRADSLPNFRRGVARLKLLHLAPKSSGLAAAHETFSAENRACNRRHEETRQRIRRPRLRGSNTRISLSAGPRKELGGDAGRVAESDRLL